MVGSVYGEGGPGPGYVSSTAKLQEFLGVASGSVTTGINSIMESALEYYRNIGGRDIAASVSYVLGDMAANISSYANGIREYAPNASEEAQPYVSGKLRVLRDKMRAKVPFEVRSYVPEEVRNSLDKIIKMNEKSGREKWEEKMRNASMARNNPPRINSYDTTASEHSAAVTGHIPTAIDLGCCDDYVLSQGLFGGFDEEESQPIQQTVRETTSHDVTLGEPHEEESQPIQQTVRETTSHDVTLGEPHEEESQPIQQTVRETTSHDVTLGEPHEEDANFLAGVYAHYHMKHFDNGEGENPGDSRMDFSSLYSHYYKKDIAEEDRERAKRASSAESTPSTHVADVDLTAHTNSTKRWIRWP